MSYLVTTPIYYVNATPHLGHAYTTIAADVISRFQRMMGNDTFFLTGTDEHGTKIFEAAAEAQMDTQEFADKNSQKFRELLPLLNAEHDFFIRTTDPEHGEYVQKILTSLHERGDIYKDTYSGLYCKACEAYYAEDDLLDGELCPDHKLPVQSMEESNWFFRLSSYQQKLIDFFEENPDWIKPKSRYNEALSFIKQGLNDLSISRSSISWGIEVPWDSEQVFYVWIDALLNYRSALTYANNKKDLVEHYWPPALQLLAKDILKFHGVIWPAILIAAELELPKQLLVHGYLTMGGDKMSKTLGNVFDPFPIIEKHGADPVRFYVLREVTFGQDGAVSQEGFERRYDTELANDLGNLVSRSISMLIKYLSIDGRTTVPATTDSSQLKERVQSSVIIWRNRMNDLDLSGALETTWDLVRELNRHIEERAPWKLAKSDDSNDQKLLVETLGELAAGIIAIAHMLLPVMPQTAEKIGQSFDIAVSDLAEWRWELPQGREATKPEPLFPRLQSKND